MDMTKKQGELMHALRKYCHQRKCRELHECPETHEICREMLGLDTSIAWSISQLLHGITRNYCNLEHAEFLLENYYALDLVLYRHRHKYKELNGILDSAEKIFVDAVSVIEKRR
jgi:hypothetical protein